MDKAYLLATFGGVTKTARALDIKPASVSGWGSVIPDSALGRLCRMYPAIAIGWMEQRDVATCHDGQPPAG